RGHLRHQTIAIARKALQRLAEHPVHVTVGFGSFKEANAAVVGVADQPGKLVLPQLALHSPAQGAGAKGQPRHLYTGFPERYPIRRRFARGFQRKASSAGERRCGKSRLQEITPGVLSHWYSSKRPRLTASPSHRHPRDAGE